MQSGILRACNQTLAAIGKDTYDLDMHIVASKNGTDTQLNTLFRVGPIRGMLGGKTYKSVTLASPTLEAFFDRCIWLAKEAPLAKMYVLFSELMISKTKDEEKRCCNEHMI